MTEEGTVKLIIDTPEGLRYVEAPDKGDVWASVEAYDALHGTNLYSLDEGEVWPDDGAYGKVIPADPDEIKAWFQKTDEYYHIMRNKDGTYSCLDCGHWFEVPEGEPLECPICRQIREAPELKPCPFCGSNAVIDETEDWDESGSDYENVQYCAFCANCGCGTSASDNPAWEAKLWNRTPESKDPMLE